MSLLPANNQVDHVHFVFLFLCIVTLPITALLSFIIFIPIFLVSCFFKSYGKFISYTDAWLDEDFVNNIPGVSIVITLTIQGNLSLNELRTHFINNVLEARSKVNPKNLRYPELKQYLTSFLGFRIWKKDTNFLVENHIKEHNLDQLEFNEGLLGNIHQKYLNKPYEKFRSPWEIILIQDINLSQSNCEPKSILVFRVHHVMADAKSLLKLIVECLGRKKLKTATYEKLTKESSWKKFKFILAFPKNHFLALQNGWTSAYKAYSHPLNNFSNYGKYSEQKLKMVVAFSPKLELSDIKKVAVKNNVKTSAVVMSIVAGAVQKFCGDKWDKDVAIGYLLPKANHPEFLTNHVHMVNLSLPTSEYCRLKRLQLCNKRFFQVKVNQKFRYMIPSTMLGGLAVQPISRIATTIPIPICITNNAGEEEGFSIGSAECKDFRMSVGPSHRCGGVTFCTMSYKGGLGIAVIAKESIIKKETAENIAQHLALELKLLLEEL